MSETVTAIPGIRVVDGRQVPEANREDWGLTWNTLLETAGGYSPGQSAWRSRPS